MVSNEPFFYRRNEDGTIDSVCTRCFVTVGTPRGTNQNSPKSGIAIPAIPTRCFTGSAKPPSGIDVDVRRVFTRTIANTAPPKEWHQAIIMAGYLLTITV
jgi:hypothetical protein